MTQVTIDCFSKGTFVLLLRSQITSSLGAFLSDSHLNCLVNSRRRGFSRT
jgi:hypothetical protein